MQLFSNCDNVDLLNFAWSHPNFTKNPDESINFDFFYYFVVASREKLNMAVLNQNVSDSQPIPGKQAFLFLLKLNSHSVIKL